MLVVVLVLRVSTVRIVSTVTTVTVGEWSDLLERVRNQVKEGVAQQSARCEREHYAQTGLQSFVHY